MQYSLCIGSHHITITLDLSVSPLLRGDSSQVRLAPLHASITLGLGSSVRPHATVQGRSQVPCAELRVTRRLACPFGEPWQPQRYTGSKRVCTWSCALVFAMASSCPRSSRARSASSFSVASAASRSCAAVVSSCSRSSFAASFSRCPSYQGEHWALQADAGISTTCCDTTCSRSRPSLLPIGVMVVTNEDSGYRAFRGSTRFQLAKGPFHPIRGILLVNCIKTTGGCRYILGSRKWEIEKETAEPKEASEAR